jgi:uroporphyrinogen-III synthase
MRVIVTRPALQALPWVERLRALGVDAVALPLIDIAPAEDPAPLVAAWHGLAGQSLVMFVSANAVAHFFAQRPAGAAWPAGVLAGSTGPGTSAALLEAGVDGGCLVEPAADAPSLDSEALWARLAHRDWAGRRVLVVRGEQGRDWLADTLRAHGAEVDFVSAYRRLPPAPGADGRAVLAAALAEPAGHLWHFSSSEAVGRLPAMVSAVAPGTGWQRSLALASHPRIAEAARALGFGHVERVAVQPEAVAAAATRLAAVAAAPAAAAAAATGPSIQSARP